MPTCSNCDSLAAFNYKPNAGTGTLYCAKHLPSFLKKDPNKALVSPVLIPDAPVRPVFEETPAVEEEPKTSKKSAPKPKADIIIEETPSEAPAEEITPETAPEEEPNQ